MYTNHWRMTVTRFDKYIIYIIYIISSVFFKLIEWSFSFYYSINHYINSFSLERAKKLKKKKQFTISKKYYQILCRAIDF